MTNEGSFSAPESQETQRNSTMKGGRFVTSVIQFGVGLDESDAARVAERTQQYETSTTQLAMVHSLPLIGALYTW